MGRGPSEGVGRKALLFHERLSVVPGAGGHGVADQGSMDCLAVGLNHGGLHCISLELTHHVETSEMGLHFALGCVFWLTKIN